MRIATIPIGYADGFNRLLSGRGECWCVASARIVSRCMDQTLIDVTDIPGVCLHDDVVCIGPRGLSHHCGRSRGTLRHHQLRDTVRAVGARAEDYITRIERGMDKGNGQRGFKA